MGINHQKNPGLNSSLQCVWIPLLYPSLNFNLSTLRGRQREISNTLVIYSPHFRRWYGLPLTSKLGIVFNLNNNNNNNSSWSNYYLPNKTTRRKNCNFCTAQLWFVLKPKTCFSIIIMVIWLKCEPGSTLKWNWIPWNHVWASYIHQNPRHPLKMTEHYNAITQR